MSHISWVLIMRSKIEAERLFFFNRKWKEKVSVQLSKITKEGLKWTRELDWTRRTSWEVGLVIFNLDCSSLSVKETNNIIVLMWKRLKKKKKRKRQSKQAQRYSYLCEGRFFPTASVLGFFPGLLRRRTGASIIFLECREVTWCRSPLPCDSVLFLLHWLEFETDN